MREEMEEVDEPRMAPRHRRQSTPVSIVERMGALLPSRARMQSVLSSAAKMKSRLPSAERMGDIKKKVAKGSSSSLTFLASVGSMQWVRSMRDRFHELLEDLHHPQRKKRAHLLLLASFLNK